MHFAGVHGLRAPDLCGFVKWADEIKEVEVEC